MASASAGRIGKKSVSRFNSSGKRLRTAGKTSKGRFATKAEMKANTQANNTLKAKFKQSIRNTKNSRARQANNS